MSKELNSIRKKIDSIDNKIHDLLMERADLVSGVVAAKRKDNLPMVQPAREANMIRRLIARHKGALPEATIVRIWRELVGAVSLLQTGFNVGVSCERDGTSPAWDMAKNYFGSVLPMKKIMAPLAALAAVREDEIAFAVLPWPKDGHSNPWWSYLINQEEDSKISIVGSLPYGGTKEQLADTQSRALVLSKIPFKTSGDDHSFLALEVDSNVSRGRIIDILKELDFHPLNLLSKAAQRPDDLSIHLLELNDFVAEDDERLEKLRQDFESQIFKCVSVGGYPVPPVYQEEIKVRPDIPSLVGKA